MKINSINLMITLFVVSFVDSIKRDKIIACVYNVEKGPPSVIDANLCTHVLVQGIFTMNSAPHHLVFKNYERNKKIFDRLKGLKSQNVDLKIVASYDCYGIECYFDKVVTTSEKITKFVNSAIKLMREHKFNGLHLSWRYPVCPKADCTHYRNDGEKKGFSDLLSELKKKLSDKETLSATVKQDKWLGEHAYDFDTMKSLDFLTLWTFDRRGPWSEFTDHHALLAEVNEGLKYWKEEGVDKNKILMGISFYGIKVKLEHQNNNDIGHKIETEFEWPPPESFYSPKYIMPYNQICQHIKNDGWSNESKGQDPFSYKGKQWVSFENPSSVERKVELVHENKLGGVAVWEVTDDDIDAKCSTTDRPLLRKVAKTLFN